MINMIFGIIVAIVAFGIYQQKWSPTAMERTLARPPVWIQAALPTLLALTLWTSLFGMNNILGLPHFMMDQAGLFVHEAGHFYLVWAGEFLNILGGTLFELGTPMARAIWLYMMGHQRWTAIFIAWLSVGFFGVALYAGDAQDRVLPLLGVDKDGHDWHNMLSMLGWLDATPMISDAFWACGLVSGITSILWASWAIYRSNRPDTPLPQGKS